MTVDVNVTCADARLLDDIEEIMEDTMVQMFIVQARDEASLEAAVEAAAEHPSIFYVAPAELCHATDANCVGVYAATPEALEAHDLSKPLFVEERYLDAAMSALLEEGACRGIILDATRPHPELEHFFVAIGPGSVSAFDLELLAALPMDRIVLQSGYPDYGFEQIFDTVKQISDVMFRPEQSIIANATRNALTLLGFKKG